MPAQASITDNLLEILKRRRDDREAAYRTIVEAVAGSRSDELSAPPNELQEYLANQLEGMLCHSGRTLADFERDVQQFIERN